MCVKVEANLEENFMAKYDSILGAVGNTPVVRVNKLAPNGVKSHSTRWGRSKIDWRLA